MRKILFYGGCHAQVLRNVFTDYAKEQNTSFDALLNYKLIASGAPFPYDKLLEYDTVLFSPIQNKTTYNTSYLKDKCADLNVRCLTFPWLQWNGYFPFAAKSKIMKLDIWHHSIENNLHHDVSITDFFRNIQETFKDERAIVDACSRTTETLVRHEDTCQCDIRVSNFIVENYRKRRLFMTPDHPTRALYIYVAREISKKCEIPIRENIFDENIGELQPDLKMPIPPEIANSLKLSFSDSSFEMPPRITTDYEGYKLILYGQTQEATWIRATRRTELTAHDYLSDIETKDKRPLAVPLGSIMQIASSKTKGEQAHADVYWSSFHIFDSCHDTERLCRFLPRDWEVL